MVKNGKTTSAAEEAAEKHRLPDLVVFIISLVLALGLWVYVAAGETGTFEAVIADVEININNSGKRVLEQSAKTVDVTVVGKRGAVEKLTAADIGAYADASDKDTGRFTLPVTVVLPDGVSAAVKAKSVDYISVMLGEITKKTIPVQAYIANFNTDGNYELGVNEAHFSTDEITIEGAEADVEKVSKAMVRLSLGHVVDSVSATGELFLADENGNEIVNNDIILSHRTVDVEIPLYTTKFVPLAVDFLHGLYNSKNADIKVDPPRIELRGTKSDLAAIEKIVVCTIDEKREDFETRTAGFSLPQGVTSVNGINSAKVTLKHIGTSVREVVCPIQVNNPNNLSYTLASLTINITLRGDTQYLSYMSSDRITAMVDLSQLGVITGKSIAAVKISIAEPYTGYVWELGDYSVTVNIK